MSSSSSRRKNGSPSSNRRGSSSSSRSAPHRRRRSSESRSTAPAPVPRAEDDARKAAPANPRPRPARSDEDVSPSTSLYSRSSVDSYMSSASEHAIADDDDDDDDETDHRDGDGRDEHPEIPPLPEYRPVTYEPYARPSNHQDFARLFPTMDRLSVRHDENTSDGNMNLRIDAPAGPGGVRTPVQLFHLRMYDLGRREFSLRRYCRDSGREVCLSKREYAEPPADGRPNLQHSMSSALKSLGSSGSPLFRRSSGGGRRGSQAAASPEKNKRPSSSRSNGSSSSSSRGGGSRSDYGYSRSDSADSSRRRRNEGESGRSKGEEERKEKKATRREPTDTIKLQFSNYARVDVRRRGRGNVRYEFEWWGHRYAWKRTAEKEYLGGGGASFHLMREGASPGAAGSPQRPLAHVVPEARSPNQVLADEEAGGWMPPCFMWLSDESVIDCQTDVADVIMATGLIALVDDRIEERWQAGSKSSREEKDTATAGRRKGSFSSQTSSRQGASTPTPPAALKRATSSLSAVVPGGPKAFMHSMFRRRHSHHKASSSRERYASPVAAY